MAQAKDYPAAIEILDELISRSPFDPILLSAQGRLHLQVFYLSIYLSVVCAFYFLCLQLGSVRTAAELFQKVESILPDADRVPLAQVNRYVLVSLCAFLSLLSHPCRGYIALALDKFDIAAQHFKTAFELDPSSAN
jgi:tetratricopeptide (TPR) repeat protein